MLSPVCEGGFCLLRVLKAPANSQDRLRGLQGREGVTPQQYQSGPSETILKEMCVEKET